MQQTSSTTNGKRTVYDVQIDTGVFISGDQVTSSGGLTYIVRYGGADVLAVPDRIVRAISEREVD